MTELRLANTPFSPRFFERVMDALTFRSQAGHKVRKIRLIGCWQVDEKMIDTLKGGGYEVIVDGLEEDEREDGS